MPKHKERVYDDFKDQALLPRKLSQLGPGISFGDINQDGYDDLYIGGASGEAGKIMIFHPEGINSGFKEIKQDAFLEGTYDWTTEDSNEYDLLTDRLRQSR